jgi:hypothetical protein
MRKKSKEHECVNEDLQNLLSYVGELIDDSITLITDKTLTDLYKWLEIIMVRHHDIYSN